MKDWKEVKLGEVTLIDTGFAFKSKNYSNTGELRVVRGKNITVCEMRWGADAKFWNHSTEKLKKYFLAEGDIVIGMDGSKVGENRSVIKENDLPAILAQRVCRIRAKSKALQEFIWQNISTERFVRYIKSIHTGTSIPHISQKQVGDFIISLPPLPEQKAIAAVLSSLDEKIDLLHQQNKTLEELAATLFRQWFVEEVEEDWEVYKLEELVDIGIGRTPPRKQTQWFSTSNEDIKWISIKDLANSGVFVLETSEYLTQEAVDKFNVPIIPPNTIVLSFKMTVGRVAITTEEMLSNEAIAHFRFNENTPFSKEFLYCYLKAYPYQTLGSTSSIVTSINSKIIRNLEVIVPTYELLKQFNKHVEMYFAKIRANQTQIKTLENLRDTLLPKLMDGTARIAGYEKD